LNLIDFLGLIDCDEFAKFFESKENLAKMSEMMEKLRKLH